MTHSFSQFLTSGLRQFRLDQELKQEYVACVTGLDRTFVSKAENNKRNLSMQSLDLLLSSMAESPRDFLTFLSRRP